MYVLRVFYFILPSYRIHTQKYNNTHMRLFDLGPSLPRRKVKPCEG